MENVSNISTTILSNTKSTPDPSRANFIKWENTLKQFVDNLPTNCLSVFDHFVGLALKGLRIFVLAILID